MCLIWLLFVAGLHEFWSLRARSRLRSTAVGRRSHGGPFHCRGGPFHCVAGHRRGLEELKGFGHNGDGHIYIYNCFSAFGTIRRVRLKLVASPSRSVQSVWLIMCLYIYGLTLLIFLGRVFHFSIGFFVSSLYNPSVLCYFQWSSLAFALFVAPMP